MHSISVQVSLLILELLRILLYSLFQHITVQVTHVLLNILLDADLDVNTFHMLETMITENHHIYDVVHSVDKQVDETIA